MASSSKTPDQHAVVKRSWFSSEITLRSGTTSSRVVTGHAVGRGRPQFSAGWSLLRARWLRAGWLRPRSVRSSHHAVSRPNRRSEGVTAISQPRAVERVPSALSKVVLVTPSEFDTVKLVTRFRPRALGRAIQRGLRQPNVQARSGGLAATARGCRGSLGRSGVARAGEALAPGLIGPSSAHEFFPAGCRLVFCGAGAGWRRSEGLLASTCDPGLKLPTPCMCLANSGPASALFIDAWQLEACWRLRPAPMPDVPG